MLRGAPPPVPVLAGRRPRHTARLGRVGITSIDYKDTGLLQKFLSDRGEIRSPRVTRVTVQQHCDLATAIKNALLPYANR